MPAVQIGIGIEQMRFEPRFEPAHGWPQPEIGDPVDGAAVERVVGSVAR